MQPFISGLMLCAGLIIAIGPQNIELLRVGLLQQKNALLLASIYVFCDLLLIFLGTLGVSQLIPMHYKPVMIVLAFVFLASLGISSFRRSLQTKKGSKNFLQTVSEGNKQRIFFKGIALSLLNPMVLLETVVIIGGASIEYPQTEKILFAIGAVSFSAIWFYGMAFGTKKFSCFFQKPKNIQILELTVGCIMICSAFWILIKGIFLA